MKLTAAKCPSCGAAIEVNKKLEKTICQYCGTTVLVEDAIAKFKLELSGKVEVDGISSHKSKLEKARKYIKLKEYNNANTILSEMVRSDALDEEAYYELLRMKLCILDDEEFDGKTNRFDDKKNWKVLDEAFDVKKRIEKIDDDDSLKDDMKKIQSQIDKYQVILDNFEKERKALDKYKDKINELIKKPSIYNIHSTSNKNGKISIMRECFGIGRVNNFIELNHLDGNGTIYIQESNGEYFYSCEDKDMNVEKMKSNAEECIAKLEKYNEDLEKKGKKEYTFTIIKLIVAVFVVLLDVAFVLGLFFDGHWFLGALLGYGSFYLICFCFQMSQDYIDHIKLVSNSKNGK